jgi:hypothetical protein
MHLVTPPNLTPGQFDGFWLVSLEIQAEGSPRRQRLELAVKLIP